MATSLNRKVGEVAWQVLRTTIEGKDRAFRTSLKALCQSFPSCVHNNGLALAVTFYRGKGDEHLHATYLTMLVACLQRGAGLQIQDDSQLEGHALRDRPLAFRDLNTTVLLAALWLKRMAEAECRD